MSDLPAKLMDYSERFVDRRQVKGIYVRLGDGQLVECEVDEHGNLIPVSLIQEQEAENKRKSILEQKIPEEKLGSITEEINKKMSETDSSPAPSEEEEVAPHIQAYKEGMQSIINEEAEEDRSNPQPSKSRKGMSLRTVLEGDVPEDSDAGLAAKMIQKEMDDNSRKSPLRDRLKMESLKDSAFRARIQSIMTDNKYDRRVRNRKRGKLDMKRLWKVSTGSEAVFMQKQQRKGKMYNVVLVVDESGSMAGDDMELAAESALYLNEAFKGANINIAILGFNHFLVKHKDFDEVLDDPQGTYASMVGRARSHGAGCNHDYDALNKGYQMLEGEKAKNGGQGILMLVCDGSPAGCSGDEHLYPASPLSRSDKQQAIHFHALAKRHSENVTSVGIGIGVEAWQVPDNVTINDTADLSKTLVGLLRKKVVRG